MIRLHSRKAGCHLVFFTQVPVGFSSYAEPLFFMIVKSSFWSKLQNRLRTVWHFYSIMLSTYSELRLTFVIRLMLHFTCANRMTLITGTNHIIDLDQWSQAASYKPWFVMWKEWFEQSDFSRAPSCVVFFPLLRRNHPIGLYPLSHVAFCIHDLTRSIPLT